MRKKSKAKLLFWIPFVGGVALWYLLFADITMKIILPLAIVATIIIMRKKFKNSRDDVEVKLRKVRRYT